MISIFDVARGSGRRRTAAESEMEAIDMHGAGRRLKLPALGEPDER